MARDRFFQHHLPACGTRYNANTVIPITGTLVTGFGLELPAERGPLNADERDWARRLGEHMREALQACEPVRRLTAQALAGHGLLNAFACPMWLVLATLFDPGLTNALDPLALAGLFGLTPTEARVAVHLADGLSAKQMALARGIRETTVRTHLRQVLVKLGVARSVDAARLLRQGEVLSARPGLQGG